MAGSSELLELLDDLVMGKTEEVESDDAANVAGIPVAADEPGEASALGPAVAITTTATPAPSLEQQSFIDMAGSSYDLIVA